MKKIDFLSFVDTCIENEYVNWLVVGVQGVAEQEELIINPRANMVKKKEYYNSAYNDDMELNFNNNIKITYVAGVEKLEDIEMDIEQGAIY